MASNSNNANDPNNPNIPAFNNAQPNQPPFNPNPNPNPINAPVFGPPPPPNFFQQHPNLPIHPPFTGPHQPPHPSLAFLNHATTFNNLAAALQWQPAPQAFNYQGNAPLDVGFGGLNIQGLDLPQAMQENVPYGDGMDIDDEVERREVNFEMGGLDFGNPEEDYSEDSEFEYDDMEEGEDDDVDGQGQNQIRAQSQSEGQNLAAEPERGHEAEDISQPHAATVEENENTAAGENVYEEEDSEWEDDPIGYEDPHAATSALPPSGIPVSDYTTAAFTALDAFGIRPDAALLVNSLKRSFASTTSDDEDGDPDLIRPSLSNPNAPRAKKPRYTAHFRGPFPFLESLATHPELYFELAKHLPVAALLSLYAIQRDFHETINGHLAHAMKSCARHHAPESAAVFAHGMYQALCVCATRRGGRTRATGPCRAGCPASSGCRWCATASGRCATSWRLWRARATACPRT